MKRMVTSTAELVLLIERTINIMMTRENMRRMDIV